LLRPSRLLETIPLDYKVLGGLSYGPPWAHYLGGYQDRLLGGPLGLLDLCHTAPDGVGRKDYDGEVLGEEAIHVLYYVENSKTYPTSTLSLNRLVTLPPGLYKVRQGPLSLSYASSFKHTQSIQSYAAYRT
jgi:hypothetical protein